MSVLISPGGGLEQNYFSIDDIIMSSEKLPSTFLVPVKGLGFLDAASNKKNIEVGTKMDLPMWLVLSLGHKQRKFVSFEYTRPFKSTYREILTADASVVDLHKLDPYFYAFGQQLLRLPHNESIPMIKCLILTFSKRFCKIMDWSGNACGGDNNERQKRLDEAERTLYKMGQKSLQSFQQWEVGESRKLSTSTIVLRHRKRKHDATL